MMTVVTKFLRYLFANPAAPRLAPCCNVHVHFASFH